MKIENSKTAIKVSSIAQMVSNKQTRKSTSFVFNHSGERYYLHDGIKVSEEDFEKRFPIDMPPLIFKGVNCDGRKVWMGHDNTSKNNFK